MGASRPEYTLAWKQPRKEEEKNHGRQSSGETELQRCGDSNDITQHPRIKRQIQTSCSEDNSGEADDEVGAGEVGQGGGGPDAAHHGLGQARGGVHLEKPLDRQVAILSQPLISCRVLCF